MKFANSTTAMLLILVAFSFATKPLISHAHATHDLVLDINGQRLRTGDEYYILPGLRGRGGGLTLARTMNNSCQRHVVQAQNEVSQGLRVTFSPANSTNCVVPSGTDTNIIFSNICARSSVWKLDSYDEESGRWFITTGRVEGNPGRETIDYWFKIEKYKRNYKIVYCPSVCSYCKVMCRDVGIYTGYGRRMLALSHKPLIVMFKKA